MSTAWFKLDSFKDKIPEIDEYFTVGEYHGKCIYCSHQPDGTHCLMLLSENKGDENVMTTYEELLEAIEIKKKNWNI